MPPIGPGLHTGSSRSVNGAWCFGRSAGRFGPSPRRFHREAQKLGQSLRRLDREAPIFGREARRNGRSSRGNGREARRFGRGLEIFPPVTCGKWSGSTKKWPGSTDPGSGSPKTVHGISGAQPARLLFSAARRKTSFLLQVLRSRSTNTPSAGLVETPALACVALSTAVNLNIFTTAPTTSPTSSNPRNLPGQKRGPCPNPK